MRNRERIILKKIYCFVLAVILLAGMLFAFVGCVPRIRTDGYFTYQVMGSGKDQVVFISGLSDLGKEQRFIVIPKEIKGVKVSMVAKRHGAFAFGAHSAADFESGKLEKLFFTTYDVEVVKPANFNSRVKVLIMDNSKDFSGEVWLGGGLLRTSHKEIGGFIFLRMCTKIQNLFGNFNLPT